MERISNSSHQRDNFGPVFMFWRNLDVYNLLTMANWKGLNALLRVGSEFKYLWERKPVLKTCVMKNKCGMRNSQLGNKRRWRTVMDDKSDVNKHFGYSAKMANFKSVKCHEEYTEKFILCPVRPWMKNHIQFRHNKTQERCWQIRVQRGTISLENMNFEEGLKEQRLLSLEQTEGRYNRLHNLKASYEQDSSHHLQGKGKQDLYCVFS